MSSEKDAVVQAYMKQDERRQVEIAAGIQGKSLARYSGAILVERAKSDVDEYLKSQDGRAVKPAAVSKE